VRIPVTILLSVLLPAAAISEDWNSDGCSFSGNTCWTWSPLWKDGATAGVEVAEVRLQKAPFRGQIQRILFRAQNLAPFAQRIAFEWSVLPGNGRQLSSGRVECTVGPRSTCVAGTPECACSGPSMYYEWFGPYPTQVTPQILRAEARTPQP
jgi:hypothetical protein